MSVMLSSRRIALWTNRSVCLLTVALPLPWQKLDARSSSS